MVKESEYVLNTLKFQYRKRYALLQPEIENENVLRYIAQFQYRKRYALLQPIKVNIDELCFVSIPQAVRAVATVAESSAFATTSLAVSIPQAVRAVATSNVKTNETVVVGFNTASGTRCCNSRVCKSSIYAVPKASFGKPQTVNGKFSPH